MVDRKCICSVLFSLLKVDIVYDNFQGFSSVHLRLGYLLASFITEDF